MLLIFRKIILAFGEGCYWWHHSTILVRDIPKQRWYPWSGNVKAIEALLGMLLWRLQWNLIHARYCTRGRYTSRYMQILMPTGFIFDWFEVNVTKQLWLDDKLTDGPHTHVASRLYETFASSVIPSWLIDYHFFKCQSIKEEILHSTNGDNFEKMSLPSN